MQLHPAPSGLVVHALPPPPLPQPQRRAADVGAALLWFGPVLAGSAADWRTNPFYDEACGVREEE